MSNTTRTLYNEYRPKTFDDIVGQSVPVTTMKNALTSAQPASAYLLSGPRGVGKTTAARIFAQGLLCNTTDRDNADGCGECVVCKNFVEGLAGDFIEIDAATNRGIDNIRNLKEQIYMAPVASQRKVVLIDEVHHLTSEAATGLLKILEEPPTGVVFLLATTDPQKIPATIRSRCQWLKFKPLEPREIENRLNYVLGCEHKEAENGVTTLVSKKANGGMRDALSMMDMLITYAQGERITLEIANECFGVVSNELIEKLVDFIATNNTGQVVGFTVRHKDSDVSPKELMISLLDVFSLALIQSCCGIDTVSALELPTQNELNMSNKISELFNKQELVRASHVIEKNLWKFDLSALDSNHVFNEIMLQIVDKDISSALTDKIDYVKDKTDNIAQAINVLIEIEKKKMGR